MSGRAEPPAHPRLMTLGQRYAAEPAAAAPVATTTTWDITLDAVERVPSMRGIVIAALATIGIAFGGFLGWSLFASLDSAAVAPGVVIVDSHRKTVQHLEGGILDQLLVREGDFVTAGQVLLRLDDTAASAKLGQLRSQRWAALAREARLRAEQADARTMIPPPDLLNRRDDPAIARILATEEELFRSRWAAFEGAVAMLEQRIEQLHEQIAAIDAQETANQDQLNYTNEELGTVRQLVGQGYERRPRLLELQRAAAALAGEHSELVAQRAQAAQEIASARLEIINLRDTRRTEIFAELQATQAELAELDDQIRAARDVVERTEVVAPQDGLVTNLQYFTRGGVIGAGSPILDIVPVDDELLVEAMIRPTDIDAVRIGLPAQIRLTAYKQRTTPVIEGTVVHVSADQLIDERTGDSYFDARVELDPDSLASVNRVELYPGMPAEVIIVTGERRAIDYFLSPVTDAMHHAFREE